MLVDCYIRKNIPAKCRYIVILEKIFQLNVGIFRYIVILEKKQDITYC